MNVDDYQKDADRTAIHDVQYDQKEDPPGWISFVLQQSDYDATSFHARERLASAGLGIAGEAGEVSDIIKKVLYQGHPLDRNKISEELGDVMWYLTQIASTLGISLRSVLEQNVAKRKARYPDGFSIEASKNRKEET